MKITAVVPIRKGSQRVKDKNLRPFAGITLLENKLNTLLNVPELDQIIVNTNSDEAIEIVKAKYADSKIRYQRSLFAMLGKRLLPSSRRSYRD